MVNGDPFPGILVGALLAGGASRRMRTDKALIDVGGQPMFRHAADALAAVTPTAVQLGGDPLPGLGWQVLDDRRPDAGPAAGLETALRTFPGAAIIVCAVDLPLVTPDLLRTLVDRLGEGDVEAVVPRYGRRWHPLVAAYSQAFRKPLSAWLDAGKHDLQGLLRSRPVAALPLAGLRKLGDPRLLLANVNEPADLERVRDALRTRWASAR